MPISNAASSEFEFDPENLEENDVIFNQSGFQS